MKSFFDVAIVGAGPAGIFSALELSSKKNVLLIDAGKNLEQKYCFIEDDQSCRFCRPACSIISGFGGSQFFEGTKLSRYPAGTGLLNFVDSREELEKLYDEVDVILEENGKYRRYFPSEEKIKEIQESFKQVGIDVKYYNAQKVSKLTMNKIALNIREKLESQGVIIRTCEKVLDIVKKADRYNIQTHVGEYAAKDVILAVGRIGSRWLAKIADTIGIKYHPENINSVEIGVRVEMPYYLFDNINNVFNDIKLKKVIDDQNELRSFCQDYKGFITKCVYNLQGDKTMSALDGHIIGTDEEGGKMSDVVNLAVHHRYKTILRTNEIFEFVSRIQRKGKPIAQSMKSFMENKKPDLDIDIKPSMMNFEVDDINRHLPEKSQFFLKDFICQIDKVIPGFAADKNIVYAPSFEMGWEVMDLDKDFQTTATRIYIVGDVTGHFRGAMQAMVSGLIVARNILNEQIKMKKIIFLTGNQEKIDIAINAVKDSGIEIVSRKIECPEIQDDDCSIIAADSAKRAAILINEPVIKIDSGLFINGLDGFPGPYSQYVERKVDASLIVEMMIGIKDRTAYYKESLAYAEPDKEPIIFESFTKGSIALELDGSFGWNFDRIFIKDGDSKTMANYPDEERITKYETSWVKFVNYYSSCK